MPASQHRLLVAPVSVPSRIAVQHQVGGGAVGRGAARRARDLSGGRHYAREDRPARDALRRHATQPWRQGKALILSQHHGLCIFSCCFAAPKLSRPRFSSQLLPIAARWNDCLSEFCVTPSSPPWTASEPASDCCIAGAHLRHSFLHETRQADGSGSNVHRCSTLMKFL